MQRTVKGEVTKNRSREATSENSDKTQRVESILGLSDTRNSGPSVYSFGGVSGLIHLSRSSIDCWLQDQDSRKWDGPKTGTSAYLFCIRMDLFTRSWFAQIDRWIIRADCTCMSRAELLASCSGERSISNSDYEQRLYVVGDNKSRDAAGAMAQEWLHQ
jgi:hypothetical protein